jgi:hypothetical protein
LIQGLLKSQLVELTADSGEAVKRVALHLMGVLGLETGLPPIPLVRVASNPSTLHDWFLALVGSPPQFQAWFGHIAGLLGADPPSGPPANGTEEDPLSALILALDTDSALELTVATRRAPDTNAVTVAVWRRVGPGVPRIRRRSLDLP